MRAKAEKFNECRECGGLKELIDGFCVACYRKYLLGTLESGFFPKYHEHFSSLNAVERNEVRALLGRGAARDRFDVLGIMYPVGHDVITPAIRRLMFKKQNKGNTREANDITYTSFMSILGGKSKILRMYLETDKEFLARIKKHEGKMFLQRQIAGFFHGNPEPKPKDAEFLGWVVMADSIQEIYAESEERRQRRTRATSRAAAIKSFLDSKDVDVAPEPLRGFMARLIQETSPPYFNGDRVEFDGNITVWLEFELPSDPSDDVEIMIQFYTRDMAEVSGWMYDEGLEVDDIEIKDMPDTLALDVARKVLTLARKVVGDMKFDSFSLSITTYQEDFFEHARVKELERDFRKLLLSS